MPINAAAQLSIQVPSGPTLSETWDVKVDAYDHLSVVVPNGATGSLNLQPGAGDLIALLLITASKYEDPPTLKFQFGAGTSFDIAHPQVISGADLVDKVSTTPSTIKFTNSGTADVTVTALVFRKAS
jgi:hypothetical protein